MQAPSGKNTSHTTTTPSHNMRRILVDNTKILHNPNSKKKKTSKKLQILEAILIKIKTKNPNIPYLRKSLNLGATTFKCI